MFLQLRNINIFNDVENVGVGHCFMNENNIFLCKFIENKR